MLVFLPKKGICQFISKLTPNYNESSFLACPTCSLSWSLIECGLDFGTMHPIVLAFYSTKILNCDKESNSMQSICLFVIKNIDVLFFGTHATFSLKWLIPFQKDNWLRLCDVMSYMWCWHNNLSCLVFILLDIFLVRTPCYDLFLPIAINILLISMSLTASLLGMSSDESIVFFSPKQAIGRLLQEIAKSSWVALHLKRIIAACTSHKITIGIDQL